ARELDAGLLTRWKWGRITKNESKFYLVIMSRSVTTFRHTALSHTVSVREPDVSTLNRRVVRLSSSTPPDLLHTCLWIWGFVQLSAARTEKVRTGQEGAALRMLIPGQSAQPVTGDGFQPSRSRFRYRLSGMIREADHAARFLGGHRYGAPDGTPQTYESQHGATVTPSEKRRRWHICNRFPRTRVSAPHLLLDTEELGYVAELVVARGD